MAEIIEKYTTEAEADNLKVIYADKVLVEVQDHEDGKYLIFGDTPRATNPPTVEERLAALEAANTDLGARLATVEAAKL